MSLHQSVARMLHELAERVEQLIPDTIDRLGGKMTVTEAVSALSLALGDQEYFSINLNVNRPSSAGPFQLEVSWKVYTPAGWGRDWPTLAEAVAAAITPPANSHLLTTAQAALGDPGDEAEAAE